MAKRRKKLKPLSERKANPKSDYWKEKADDLWKRIIHRTGVCGCRMRGDCSGNLEAHHIITRANKPLRHKIENGVLLCSKHHKFCTKVSAHAAPHAFYEHLEKWYPEQHKWASENKFKTGEYNYQEDYENLLIWCKENAPELL